MTPQDIQAIFRERLGLRIGPHMADYVLRQLTVSPERPTRDPFPIMANSARTGVPLRLPLAPASLLPLDPES